MPLDLPLASIIEKNKFAGDYPFLILLEIQIDPQTTIRVVKNTEEITWQGQTWVPFPFELDEMSEGNKGENFQFTIKVSNITKTIQRYVEQANGGMDYKVILRVVNAGNLAANTPDLEIFLENQYTHYDDMWVYFVVGGSGIWSLMFPLSSYLKDWCRFEYGGIECGINPTKLTQYPTCNGTLSQCRQRGNSKRFGGEPAIGGGFYRSNS